MRNDDMTGLNAAFAKRPEAQVVKKAKEATKKPVSGSKSATKKPVSGSKTPTSWSVTPIDTKLIDIWSLADRPDSEMGNIDQLVDSIHASGQSVPGLVRPSKGGRYELIYGRRRFEACKILDCNFVAEILEIDDQEAFARMEGENNDRQSLSIWAKCLSYKKSLDTGLFDSQTQLAFKIGQSRTEMSRAINFANVLSGEVSNTIDLNKHGMRMLRPLFSIASTPDGKKWLINNATQINEGLIKQGDLNAYLLDKKVEGKKSPAVTYKVDNKKVFSIGVSKNGDIAVTILKAGREVMTAEELAEKLQAIFESES